MFELDKISQDICFTMPELKIALPSKQVAKWFDSYANMQFYFTDIQAESLARIIPLLACGEQSAICVFEKEVSRMKNSGYKSGIQDLQQVVNEEFFHDKLLHNLQIQLPKLNDNNKIKSKAKLFYARIGHQHALSTHFLLISKLDACVCKLLNAMEKSNLGKNHPVTYLCNIIKKDEAKHVGISRKHSKALSKKDQFCNIEADLLNLLQTEASAFEGLGIDFDKLRSQFSNFKYLEVA
jgi:uncharacterized ferritin-like protein (DUF455 family)